MTSTSTQANPPPAFSISSLGPESPPSVLVYLFFSLDLGSAYNDPPVIVFELVSPVRICGRWMWMIGIYHVGQNLDAAPRV